MDLKQMYTTLMQMGYDKPRVLNTIKQGMNPNVGYLISQYGESTPEVALANAYPEVFGYQEDHSVFPSDLPSLSGWKQDAYKSADFFNKFGDNELLNAYTPDPNTPMTEEDKLRLMNLYKAFGV